jgi:hypothetical protein
MSSALARLRGIRRQSSGRTDPTPVAAPSFDYFGSPYADLFADLTRDIGTPADLESIAWAERNGWPTIAATLRDYDRRCEQIAARSDEPAFRHAVEQLVGLFRAIREAHEANQAQPEAPAVASTPGQWRLVVGRPMHLRPPPIQIDRARSVVRDVAGHVEILLAKLAIAVEHKNAGRRGSFYAASADEWLAELTLCGVTVSLEVVQ